MPEIFSAPGQKVSQTKWDGIFSKKVKRDIVQLRNPRTGHYVKIDRDKGQIIAHKQTLGPYKNIKIIGYD